MSRRALPALALAALVTLGLSTTGCASRALPVRDAGAAQEIATLKQRLLEMQRQMTVHQVEIERLRERINELEGRGGTAVRRPAAGSSSSLGSPTSDPSRGSMTPPPASRRPDPAPPSTGSRPRATDDIETVDLSVEDLTPDPVPTRPSRDESADPDPTGRRSEPARPTTGSASSQPPSQPADDAGGGRPVTEAARALYDQGFTLHHQGRYVDAETTFQRFLQAYGDTELADNAGYWIGESRYARQDYRGALAAFREMVDRHPDGNKVPDALLKMGLCLEQLGDLAGAREVYTEIIRRFPGYAASVTAEERRATLP